jgi:hypothetical protein
MQREKLYNLQRTVDFLSVLFMLKDASNYVRPVFHNDKGPGAQSVFVFDIQTYQYM